MTWYKAKDGRDMQSLKKVRNCLVHCQKITVHALKIHTPLSYFPLAMTSWIATKVSFDQTMLQALLRLPIPCMAFHQANSTSRPRKRI